VAIRPRPQSRYANIRSLAAVRNSLSAIASTRNLQRVRLLSFKTIPYTLTREDSMLKFIA
jgi:hypothetical protein